MTLFFFCHPIAKVGLRLPLLDMRKNDFLGFYRSDCLIYDSQKLAHKFQVNSYGHYFTFYHMIMSSTSYCNEGNLFKREEG